MKLRMLVTMQVFSLVLGGCTAPRIRLNARQEAVRDALAKVDPHHHPLPPRTRIIDVHTHTFNARYLPLEGIFLGKRDISPVASWLSDDCARRLAAALVERTELDASGGEGLVRRPRGRQSLEPQGDWVCRLIIGLLNKAEARGAWDRSVPDTQRKRIVEEVATEMNFQERMAVRVTASMMGMEEHVEGKGMTGLVAAVRFIWQATQMDSSETAFFRRDYQPAPMRGHPLMVSHMMDLGPVYNQKPAGVTLLDFGTSQIRRMRDFQNRRDAGMIYFVAYNPYRDHAPAGSSGEALGIVRRAIEQEGAWGVKFYPPSGYRAAGNAIKNPPGSGRRQAQEQWKARYEALGADRNARLDAAADTLLAWCVQHDVPVFAHCGTGEFEAQKGYGVYHSDPRYWRMALEKHPQLRLCLGHAGGDDYWFGGGKYSAWGEEVIKLCRQYPNVYCEVTNHADLLQPEKQAWFADRLIEEFAKDPQVEHPAVGYKLSRKLLYGTDWYLPDASQRYDVLVKMEQVFLHPELEKHYEDYFCGNAARYLNIGERWGRIRSKAVRERLQPFAKYRWIQPRSPGMSRLVLRVSRFDRAEAR